MVSSERKKVNELQELASAKLTWQDTGQVGSLTVQELWRFGEELAAQRATKEETVRGYRVNVNYKPLDAEEKRACKRAISNVIVGALKHKERGSRD